MVGKEILSIQVRCKVVRLHNNVNRDMPAGFIKQRWDSNSADFGLANLFL